MIIILGLFIECAAHRKHPCNRCLYASINNHKVQSKGENWIYDDVRHFHGCFMQPQFMTTVGVWRKQPTATDYDDDDGSWAIHIDVGTHTHKKRSIEPKFACHSTIKIMVWWMAMNCVCCVIALHHCHQAQHMMFWLMFLSIDHDLFAQIFGCSRMPPSVRQHTKCPFGWTNDALNVVVTRINQEKNNPFRFAPQNTFALMCAC